jgi:EpsI family protein
MGKNQFRLIITIIITLVAAGIVHEIHMFKPIKNDIFFQFPLVIGEWRGKEIPMSDWVYRGLETPYVFLRDYSSSKQHLTVNLSLVWFDDTNFAFHSSESCMSDIMRERKIIQIDTASFGKHEVVKMIVEINNQKHLLLYFFDVDGFITTSQEKIRLESFNRRLQFKRSSATFVRIMAPLETDEAETMPVLLRFLNDVYPFLPEYTYTNKILIKKA